MTDKQIKGNELISKFMGSYSQYKKAEKYYQNEIAGGFPDYTGLKYHKSFDWLMPVVEVLINGCYNDDINLNGLLNAIGKFNLKKIYHHVVKVITEINQKN